MGFFSLNSYRFYYGSHRFLPQRQLAGSLPQAGSYPIKEPAGSLPGPPGAVRGGDHRQIRPPVPCGGLPEPGTGAAGPYGPPPPAGRPPASGRQWSIRRGNAEPGKLPADAATSREAEGAVPRRGPLPLYFYVKRQRTPTAPAPGCACGGTLRPTRRQRPPGSGP